MAEWFSIEVLGDRARPDAFGDRLVAAGRGQGLCDRNGAGSAGGVVLEVESADEPA